MPSRTLRMNVEPLYGWGWTDHRSNSALAVPPAFVVSASIESTDGRFSATGQVELPGHLLDGLFVSLAQRHREWDGQCSLCAFAERPAVPAFEKPVIEGFVVVTLLGD